MALSILTYLIESTLCIGVFYLLYKLLLSRSTHFQWNRFYLVSIVLLSAIIPLIDVPISYDGMHEPSTLHEAVVASDNIETEFLSPLQETEKMAEEPMTSAVENSLSLSISEVILLLYFIGFCYFSARFLQNIWVMFKLIRNNQISKVNGFYLIKNRLGLPTFSFFKYVFLETRDEDLSDSEIQQILHHEAVHIEQRHSLDILLFNLFEAIFWFNPLIKYLKESIREAHEFIADYRTVKHTTAKELEEYSRLIVKLSAQRSALDMSSNFSKMEVKKRILMLGKLKSSNAQKLKFVLVLPLLAVMLTAFSLSKQMNGKMDRYTVFNAKGEVSRYFIREYDSENHMVKNSEYYKDGDFLYFTNFEYEDGLLVKHQRYHGDRIFTGEYSGESTGVYTRYTYNDTLLIGWYRHTQAGTGMGGVKRTYDKNNYPLKDTWATGRQQHETDNQGRIVKTLRYNGRGKLTHIDVFKYRGEEVSKRTIFRGDGTLYQTHTVLPL